MRTAATLSCALLLSACGQAEPDDGGCGFAARTLDQCMAMHRDLGGRTTAESCVPLLPAERISGTWVHGAGANRFLENEEVSAETGAETELVRSESGTGLVFEGTALEGLAGPSPRRIRVTFVGRRPSCDLEAVFPYLVVDRVIASEVLTQGQAR